MEYPRIRHKPTEGTIRMKTIKTDGLDILCWCENPEEGALKQARNIARFPGAFHHVALMPDTHQGYGMPIGGVLAVKGRVIPNAVGVDIGCGMCAVRSSLKEISQENLKKILGLIRERIPVGFNKHAAPQDPRLMPAQPPGEICKREYSNASRSLGTAGGGNHFIECQYGSDGYLWVMLHSGSRNLGKQVADRYNKIAEDYCRHSDPALIEQELAYLPEDEQARYLYEMKYCVDFALASRKLMLDRIQEIFLEVLGSVEFLGMINIAHNYAALECHYGEMVWVHRKGATSARSGEIGIIPGSQGTSSYIVRGKGNPLSLQSCSHGAGRKMGRKQAERTLNLEEEIKKLDDQGILHAIRGKQDLDEASGAYKDIAIVMEEQKDLVEILVELKPLAVIKG